MVSVTWSRRALDDLDAVCAYISLDSPSIAGVFARKLVDATRRLGEFARSGRVVPEFEHESVREILVQRYRIIYRIRPDRVTILAIQHGAMRIGSAGPGSSSDEEE